MHTLCFREPISLQGLSNLAGLDLISLKDDGQRKTFLRPHLNLMTLSRLQGFINCQGSLKQNKFFFLNLYIYIDRLSTQNLL